MPKLQPISDQSLRVVSTSSGKLKPIDTPLVVSGPKYVPPVPEASFLDKLKGFGHTSADIFIHGKGIPSWQTPINNFASSASKAFINTIFQPGVAGGDIGYEQQIQKDGGTKAHDQQVIQNFNTGGRTDAASSLGVKVGSAAPYFIPGANAAVVGMQAGNELGNLSTQGGIANNKQDALRVVGEAGLNLLPGVPLEGVTGSLKPVAKFVANNTVRGAENVARGQGSSLIETGKLDPSSAPEQFGVGFGLGTILNPQETLDAVKAPFRATAPEVSPVAQAIINNPVTNNQQSPLKIPQERLQQLNDKANGAMVINPATGKKTELPKQVLSFSELQERNNLEGQVKNARSVQEYIKAQEEKQKAAAEAANPTTFQAKVSALQKKLKSGFVDSQAAIEDTLAGAEQKGGFNVVPSNDIRLQQANVRRSDQLATQFIHDNGLADVIKQAPDLGELNQYLIARHSADLQNQGVTTGRDTQMDGQLLHELGPTYEPLAKKVTDYSQKSLDYAVQSGLISPDTASYLKEKYPNYVPIDRIFTEGEQALQRPPSGTGKGAMASQGTQSVVRRLQGSEREISNPVETLLSRTQELFQQGERNKSAQMLASYKELPGNPFQLRELEQGEYSGTKPTISVMENGEKKVYETTPEISEAAKNLNKQQLGLLGQILGGAVRVFKVGTTGLRPSFIVANLAKDQVTAAINSDHALNTSIANPLVFLKGFAAAIGKNDLFQEMQRAAGGGTSLDLYRTATKETVEQIRSKKDVSSNIMYTVTHPKALFRAAEEAVNVTEQMTRLNQYKGTKDALMAQGRTEKDATLLAAKAARENTVDFYKSGSYGQVLNSTIPYLNAGIQGSRTLVSTLRRDPVGAGAKLALTVFSPVMMATLWNISDPDRKAVYDDLQPYEKEGNMIIVTPGATKDSSTGKYNIIKIPLSQEVANLASIVRRGIEGAQGGDPETVGEVASNLFQSGTSFGTNPRQLLSTVTPQVLKGPLEVAGNIDLFTGNKVIPDSLKDLPPEMQTKDSTPVLAKTIGSALGISPLVINKLTSDYFGGVGTDVLAEKNPVTSIADRFNQASGGAIEDKNFNAIDKEVQSGAVTQAAAKQSLTAAASQYASASPQQRSSILQDLRSSGALTKSNIATFKTLIQQSAAGDSGKLTSSERYLKSQSSDVRASYIRKQIQALPKGPGRTQYLQDLARKKIATPDIIKKILNPQLISTYGQN